MKKLLISFALIGTLTFALPIVANAYITLICGHVCACDDAEDEEAFKEMFCDEFD